MISKIFAAAMLAVASAQTLVEVVQARAELTTLKATVETPAYSAVLDALLAASPAAPFTLFAPVDDATGWATISDDVELNKAILFYHAVPGKFAAADLAPKQFVNTASANQSYSLLGDKGAALGIVKAGDVVTLSNGVATFTATVVTPNINCTNGIVHTIDTLLALPQKVSEVATAANLKELVKAVTEAMLVDLVDTTPTVTIFAPTDEAMLAAKWDTLSKEALIKVLAYHVIAGTAAYSTLIVDGTISGDVETYSGDSVKVALVGGKVMINTAEVTIADALVKNGVVHVINQVLTPAAANTTDIPTGAPTTANSATASSMAFACLFSVVAAIALN